MDLKGILALSGKPGLYKMLSQSKNSIIVEGLEDKKRFPVYGAHQISALEEISIYTSTDDIPLAEVLHKIYNLNEGKPAISHKSSKMDLEKFFTEVLPDYDNERVYVSDIKKVTQWYNILLSNDLLKFDAELAAEIENNAKTETETSVEAQEKPKAEKRKIDD